MRVWEGKVLFSQAHAERLKQSVRWLQSGPRFPLSLIDETLSSPPAGTGVWRLTVDEERGRLLGQWTAGIEVPPSTELRSVVAGPRPSDWPSEIKLDAYQERLALAHGLPSGTLPLFVLPSGEVCESLYSNVVFWNSSEWVFPVPGPDALNGIGQRQLQGLLAKEKIPYRIRTVRAPEQFSGAWLVNAVRGLVPVASIDGRACSAHPRETEWRREFFLSE